MFRIELTPRARDDADEVHAWLAEHRSGTLADKWYGRLFEQIGTLSRQPARCPVAPESRMFPEVVRELVVGKPRSRMRHRILFVIREDVVVVLYIHHVARRRLRP